MNAILLIHIAAGGLALTLGYTAFATVRPPAMDARKFHIGALLVAAGIGAAELATGLGVLASGQAPILFFLFGAVALLAAWGDLRIVRSGNLQGARRLSRHLWRMCSALLIAALSFFLGQSDEFPEAIRIIPLLLLPVLVVLAAMIFWARRVRANAGPATRAR